MKFNTKLASVTLLALAISIFYNTLPAQEQEHGQRKNESESFSFALWGDMPYARNADEPKIQALIDDINASEVAFTIFDGDIKDGSSRCDDWQYTQAINRFNLFKKPMIYVPGDNEWTDCHRVNNGGFNNLERLDFIRRIMFNSEHSFGKKKLSLNHQGQLGGKFSENVRWMYNDIAFVGLNIPGSNNNKVNSDAECQNKSARTLQDCASDNAEYAERDAANISFIRDTFQKSKALQAKGIVITIQADPSFDLPETESVNERDLPGFDGFNNFLAVLIQETANFNGEVVLVHGDVHFFKIDKPLVDQAHLVKNFTRVETFGSPNVHWIKATVNRKGRSLFTFEPMLVPGN